jgi:hypothetical protein
MSQSLLNLLKATPVALGVSLLAAQASLAAPTTDAQSVPNRVSQDEALGIVRNRPKLQLPINQSENTPDSQAQVTSVSELRDVSPTDWAYEALRSLVERYGCIVGYPDRTFRGNRATSRWEFAAGLNACLNTMERLLQENVAVLREDIDKLKRLAEEFRAELAALGARVDNLDKRVSFLEDHQFSTTTKLRGEAVFSIADSFGDFASFVNPGGNQGGTLSNPGKGIVDDDISQAAFNNRVRLNLETSFTGKDLLRTRLQAGNFGTTFNQRGVTGTNMTRLAYDDGADNDITIDDFFYRFPIGDSITTWIGANALDLDDVFYTLNPYLSDSGTGSLSRLERYNNFANRGPSGTGAALRYKFTDNLNATITYLAEKTDAPDPSPGNGLFNGSYSAGAQLYYQPTDSLEVAFTYRHSYRTAGGGGIFGGISSPDAETPFGSGVANTADLFSLNASWNITKTINWASWVGYGFADAQGTPVAGINNDSVDLWTWNTAVSFADLGKEGAVLSIGGGMPPKGDVNDSSYIIQTQYKYPVTDNILITPGFYVVLNPNNNDNNDAIWMGVLRTTFKF